MTYSSKAKDQIIYILKQNLDNFKDYTVFLFWSRVNWKDKENSDYDIWIIWKNKIPYLNLLKIKRELNNLPFVIDFVDFSRIDNQIFKDLALKKTIKWT